MLLCQLGLLVRSGVKEILAFKQFLLEHHARERRRRTGFRREGLAIMEIISLAAVEQVNQGVKRREAADAAPVLILDDLVEEAGRIARGLAAYLIAARRGGWESSSMSKVSMSLSTVCGCRKSEL